ncbi:MAG: translocation/assembly module TamB domain-containing protein [Acidobacteriota bacterium]
MRLARLTRFAALVIVGLVVVVLLALVIAQTSWARNRARLAIESRASTILNGEVRLGSVRWLPSGRVDLTDLRVTQNGEPVLASQSVSVRYNTWQLLRHGLILDEVTLVQPAIHLVQHSDGWNVTKLLKARKRDSSGTSFRIAQLHVRGGSVTLNPLHAPAREFGAVDVEADVSYAQRQLRAGISRGTARDLRTNLALNRLSMTTTVGDGLLAFENIEMSAGASTIAGRIRVITSDEQSDVDIALDAQPLALSEAGYYVPQFAHIDLAPTLKIRARGPLHKMAVDLSMQSPAGNVSGRMTGGFQHDIGRFAGQLYATDLDLEPWFLRRDLQSRITGQSSFDLTLPETGFETADVTFDATLAQFVIAGYAASGVRAKGSYLSGKVDVDGSGTAYGTAVTTSAHWERTTGEVAARGHFAHLDLRRLPRRFDIPAMASTLAGRYDVVVGRKTWRADTVFEPSVLEGAEIADGATAHVDTEVPGMAYAFHGSMSRVDPDRFKPFLTSLPDRLAKLHGRFNGTIDLDARGLEVAEASGKLRLVLADSVVCAAPAGCGADEASGGTRINSLDAALALDRRRLVADVQGDAQAVSGAAFGVEHSSHAAGDGRVNAHVEIGDVLAPLSADNVEGFATATLANVSLYGQTIDQASFDLALVEGIARVTTFDVSGPSGKVSAKGTVVLAGDGQSDLSYVADVPDLKSLQSFSRQPLGGSAHIEGRISGPQGATTTTGTISGSHLVVGPVDALSVKSAYNLAVPENNVRLTTGRLDLTGTYIEVRGTRIDEVAGTLAYDGSRLDVDAKVSERQRRLQFTGSLVPHPDHREIHVRSLSMIANDVEWQMPQGQEAVARYAADRLEIENFQLARGDSRIRIEGTASANAANQALVVTVEHLQIADVNTLLLGTQRFSGIANGTARISGSLSDPAVEARISVTTGQIQDVAFDSLAGQVSLGKGQLTLDAALEAGTAGRLTATGTMPVPWRAPAGAELPPFNLRVQSAAINLALFQPLSSHIDMITGVGRFDLQVFGAAGAPRLEGLVGVQQGSFRVAPTGVIYSGVEAAMALEGERVIVQQFRVQDDDGHTGSVTGSLKVAALGRPSDFNLSVQAHEIHVLHNRFGEISLSPDLRVMGDLSSPLVTGTVKVDRGRVELGDLLDRFSATGYTRVETDVGRQVEKEIDTAAPTTGASYSVTLDLPENIVLRGRDLRATRGSIGLGDVNVTLGGALTIAKDTSGPTTLLGRLAVVRGQYSFQGRPFTILRDSELRFEGNELLNPVVDVTGERQISGVTARVHVTGTMREPEIALSSNPPLDEGDILSLIAFNQTMNQLQTSERVSLASRAGVLAARAFATPIADSVARALDFDLFEIQPADDTGTGATLTVGRQVNENLFVGFRQEFGSEDASQVSFEFRLTEFLRLVTSFAQGTEQTRRTPPIDRAGLDFIFVIRR